MGQVSRSSLSGVNQQQPYTLYESLFGRLLNHCQAHAPRHGFRFKHKLYSLDASTIDLCLSVFPWAEFRTTKGAIKLHATLDHDGTLPSFVHITEGKVHDVKVAPSLSLQKHSIVVFDRGYNAYHWFNALNSKGIWFVTRLKKNAKYRVLERRACRKSTGVTSDQVIELTGTKAKRTKAKRTKAKHCPIRLRRVGFRDKETGIRYEFLTNNMRLLICAYVLKRLRIFINRGGRSNCCSNGLSKT